MNNHISKLIARNRSIRNGYFLYENKEWMQSKYQDQPLMTLRDVANEAKCSLRTIARWMAVHGIMTKPIGYKRFRRGRTPAFCLCGNRKAKSSNQCNTCYRKNINGNRNPNWKGIADVMVLLRGHIERFWRPAIFRRDSYACCSCGDDRGHNLQAHHIVPLSRLVRDKRDLWKPEISTVYGRRDFVEKLQQDHEVMNLENGITLCADCHLSGHRGSQKTIYAAVNGHRKKRSFRKTYDGGKRN